MVVVRVYDMVEFEDHKLIPQHIQSRYSKEMASKSEVVSKKVHVTSLYFDGTRKYMVVARSLAAYGGS